MTERERQSQGAFPIVGIGASAGGLEAFTQLLKALPLDTGMGFVLVQHLDPDHESQLSQILSRATSLPVREIAHNDVVQPNRVYIIPRDTNLTLAEGVLKLQPRERTRAPHRPIDSFFESLAQDQHERAVGVVLSGTASDGTLGLEAIKAEGGITFAQDDSAKHDSMPKSAVAAGCVDLVLSPSEIANELVRVAKHPCVIGQALPPSRADVDRGREREDEPVDEPRSGKGDPAGYKKILLLLRNHSGVDFSLYKSTTIERRITRRLVLNKQNTLDAYAGFLRGNTKELDALYSDVLISVTSFFRNPETFDALQHTVMPQLLKLRGDDPLRCWVLGCSTGQEAYSIAMAFTEAAEHAPRTRRLQIFATDLNDTLLDKARHGLYAKSLAEDIAPQRLRRFFVEEEGGYRVAKSLREMVVFARQNLIADPPFSRMDLISCRNLLIYLEPSLQKKAIPTFHYALKPGGFLLLGASESVGSFTDLFEPVDKKHKIYSKKLAPIPTLALPLKKERSEEPSGTPPPLPVQKSDSPNLPDSLHGELNAQREADRITVNQFAPPGVLTSGGRETHAPEPKPAPKGRSADRKDPGRIAELESELSELREYLQSMQEQHDAANEEVQSANEEVQSANEELQSINEELETSKEELESANEELTTVNEEMSNRNVDLNRLNNDLVNLQTATKLTILLVGRDLSIRRFSPQAEKQFDLLVADVGRPISHIRHGLIEVEPALDPTEDRQARGTSRREIPLDLDALVAEVIAEVREQQREVRDRAGHWHSLRVRPYLTLDGKGVQIGRGGMSSHDSAVLGELTSGA